jgi:tetratricopeptide (TPR) repeat protein
VAVDREAALKQADTLVRQGKLDGAIAEYVRLIEDQPQDWTTMNALGDLYLRAGNNAKALEQYTRVADHQFEEGFLPKSAALYKKALRLQPDDEHILLQLADIGERQGKFVDAKQYLKQVAKQRHGRGELRGAAECILRLGSVPEADLESKLAAVQAAQQLGDGFRAVELLKEAAQVLEKQDKLDEALQLLAQAAEIDPFDSELRVRLAREFLAIGQPKRARDYLSFDTAADDVELLLALATVEFADGREEDARVAMSRVLALAPDREPDIARLADSLMDTSRVESAFACVDAITDAALLEGDALRAAAALQTFIARAPYVPALAKLVDISAEAGLADRLHETQAQLADAYLDASRGEEARIVAEQLVRSHPRDEQHANRLRRALTLAGVTDPETVLGHVRAGINDTPTDALSFDTPDLDAALAEMEHAGSVAVSDYSAIEEASDPTLLNPPTSRSALLGDDDEAVEIGEIDLSTALSGLTTAPPMAAALAPDGVVDAAEPTPDIEDVFAQMRVKAAREQQASHALAQYEEALRFIDEGLDREAIAALEAAARAPVMRFKAAGRLGRLLIDRGDLNEGVEWLERAAEAPAASPSEGHHLLYELAGALEAQGESARALAVLMELDAETDGYRDVRTRIVYLTRGQQTGSSHL